MTYPYGQAITLVTRMRDGEDAYGNDTFTESTSTVVGAFAPGGRYAGGGAESVQGQDLVTDQPTVFLPSGTDLTVIDAVEVAGVRYEVDGTPDNWRSPFTGWAPGVAASLRRVTG